MSNDFHEIISRNSCLLSTLETDGKRKVSPNLFYSLQSTSRDVAGAHCKHDINFSSLFRSSRESSELETKTFPKKLRAPRWRKVCLLISSYSFRVSDYLEHKRKEIKEQGKLIKEVAQKFPQTMQLKFNHNS
jgi:hypothetical protein